jgi:hypothetical protein
MAKKVRRVKKKRQQKKQTAPVQEDIKTTTPAAEIPAESQLSSTEQFRQEYAYVVKDLRRVLVLAAIMFALLIALNLLLQ